MTKPVRDYLARCMEDPEFAEAYQELEAEYQAERARIRTRIQKGPLWQLLKDVEGCLNRHLGLACALDWFQKIWQHLSGQPSPPAIPPQK